MLETVARIGKSGMRGSGGLQSDTKGLLENTLPGVMSSRQQEIPNSFACKMEALRDHQVAARTWK